MQSRSRAEAVSAVGEAYVSRDIDRVRGVLCHNGGDAETSLQRMALYEGELYVPAIPIIRRLDFITRTDGTVRVDLPLLQTAALPTLEIEDVEHIAVGYLIIHIMKSPSGLRTCLYDVEASF